MFTLAENVALSALFELKFMLPMEKSVTFTGACANEIIPNG